MNADEPERGLLIRTVCWLVIAVAILLALGSAMDRPHPTALPARELGADLPLRLALGTYRLSGEIALKSTDGWIDTPSRVPTQAVQQALVMEILRGTEQRAAEFLPVVDDQPQAAELQAVNTWIRARWNNATSDDPPVSFASHAGRFAGLVGNAADRERVIAESATLTMGLSLLSFLGVIALGTGCCLAVVAIVRWRRGRLWTWRTVVAHPTAYLVAFTVYLGLYLIYAGTVPGFIAGPMGMAAIWGFVLLVPIPLLLARRQGATDMRSALGFHRGAGVLREIGSGVLGYCAGLPLILLGVLATSWLSTLAPVSHPVAEMFNETTSRLMLVIVFSVAVLFAPLVEEVFFRGVLLAHLQPRLGVPLALLASSVVFAAVHPQGLAGLPALTAIAVVLGAIRCWRGSLIAPITAHALHNGTLVLMLILIAT